MLAPWISISFVVGYKRFKFVDKKGEIFAKNTKFSQKKAKFSQKKGEIFAKKRRNFRKKKAKFSQKKGENFAFYTQDFRVFLQSKSKMQGLEPPTALHLITAFDHCI